MHPYKEILSLTNGPVEYEFHPIANLIKPRNKNFPWSIKQFEFDLLRSLISSHDLKKGLEIGTGLGISTIALGLGFKDTGGKVITIDSHIEEAHDSYVSYRRSPPSILSDSKNFQSSKFLVDHFQLNDTVSIELGWSPRDTASILRNHLAEGEKLDFVFLDGGEFPEQVVKDVESFLPFLAPKNLVVLQGVFDNVYDSAVVARLKRVLRKDPVFLTDPSLPFTNRMGIVNNL